MIHKLSICIPTFNRKSILQDSIEDLLDILEVHNMELCISNNNSNDGTKEYLDIIKNKHKLIKIVHQKENNGLEQNMIDAIKMAQGEFILPIGDDEKVNISYINGIVKELKSNPEILLLNGIYGNIYQLNTEFQNLEFNDPQKAFPILWTKMQPGAFIVKRDLLYENGYLKYLGTSHAYSGWVLDSLYEKYKLTNRILVKTSGLPIIIFKEETKSWRNDAFKIIFYEIPLWLNLLGEKYSIIKDQNILKKYLVDMSKIKILLYYRVSSQNFSENVNKYMSFFDDDQIKRAVIISKVPLSLGKLYFFSLNFLRKVLK